LRSAGSSAAVEPAAVAKAMGAFAALHLGPAFGAGALVAENVGAAGVQHEDVQGGAARREAVLDLLGGVGVVFDGFAIADGELHGDEVVFRAHLGAVAVVVEEGDVAGVDLGDEGADGVVDLAAGGVLDEGDLEIDVLEGGFEVDGVADGVGEAGLVGVVAVGDEEG
jgi:hypothetical protein